MDDFLNLDSIIIKKLEDKNIVRPTSIQKLVIPEILKKQNIIFRSQTGTGKTYAYLLPIIQNILHNNQSHCLIIAPTLELGAQIKTETDFLLNGVNINAELLTGSGNIKRQIENVKKNRPNILIGNSKRILELIMLRKLNLKKIDTLVLDEADRIVSAELIDDTVRVISFLPKERINIACSATMNIKTQTILKEMLGDMLFIESDEAEILRENITHIALWSEDRKKIETLRQFLSACKPKKALVFCERSDKIEKTTSFLVYKKILACALYSGIDKKARKTALEGFRKGTFNVLVASDLASRGLDIENLPYIIELGVNEDSEVYVHRAGRTARAGKKGVMVSIGDEHDMRCLQSIEKKLRITVHPKILYKGRLCSTEEFD